MNVKDCPEIVEVKPLEDLNLLVKFRNGIKKRIDISPYLKKFQTFKALEDRKKFEDVRVDSSGGGVVWDKNIDLSACDIWEFGNLV